MNLTTLIEEQKKEALKLYTTGGSTIQSVGGETTLHTDTHTLLTTAITKGYELALEEVEKEAKIALAQSWHLAIEEKRGWDLEDAQDCLTHIAHLKTQLSAISEKV